MTISIAQDAEQIHNNSWKWAVWLDGPEAELDAVQEVIYTLHPTFSQPVQIVRNRSDNFRLTRTGWGEFQIGIQIDHKDGSISRIEHWLLLRRTQGTAPPLGAPVSSQPLIYVASTLGDTPIAEAFRQALEDRNFGTLGSSDVVKDASTVEAAQQAAVRADALLLVVNGRLSRQLHAEVEAFLSQDKQVIPLLVNGATISEPELASLEGWPLKWSEAPDQMVMDAGYAVEQLRQRLF